MRNKIFNFPEQRLFDINFQIKIPGLSPAFSILTHSGESDSLPFSDTRWNFDNQLLGLFP